MNKKIIHIFLAVCLMLAMTTTTAFAASSEMVSASNTVQVKSSSKEIHRTVRRHLYKDGKELRIVSKVTYHQEDHGSWKDYVITDVDVNLYGPLASECSASDTAVGASVASTIITMDDNDKIIGVLDYTIYGKGKLKSHLKKYV